MFRSLSCPFSICCIFQISMLPHVIFAKNDLGFFSNYQRFPGVSEDEQLVLGVMVTSEIPQIMAVWVIGFSQHEIEKLLTQNEAE